MKKAFLSILILITFLAVGAGPVHAWVSLPSAYFYFQGETTADTATENGTLSFNYGWLSTLYYTNFPESCYNGNCDSNDSMLGAVVSITPVTRESVDYFPYNGEQYPMMTFSDAVFTISDPDDGFIYFQADLTDVTFLNYAKYWGWMLNPGLSACNTDTHNLSNIVLNTDKDHPSRYIEEYMEGLGDNDAGGLKMTLIMASGWGSFFDDSRSSITGYLMGPPPDIDVDDLPRSTGFWKNHDTERSCLSYNAAKEDIDVLDVFTRTGDVSAALKVHGKKTMEEKALQQLAALLLNISAGLDPETLLTADQLALIQQIDITYGPDAAVADAVWEIESTILYGGDLELAKDLAESINNS